MVAFKRSGQSGQGSTEYMLLISVVVIGIAAAAYAFVPQFRNGTSALSVDVSSILDNHTIGGVGLDANGNSGTTGNPNGGNPGSGTAPDAAPGNNQQASGAGVYTENNNGGIFNTETRAGNAGTGGTETAGQAISSEDSWKSFIQGELEKAAEQAGMQGEPICGPVALAALTGQTFDRAFLDNLRDKGYLETVTKSWKIGDATLFTSTSQPGIMTIDKIAEYLQNEAGWKVNNQTGATIADIQRAVDAGQEPVVLYDRSQANDGSLGHFAVVKGIVGNDVILDHSGAREWIPIEDFNRRFGATGGRMVSGTPPPSQTTGAVASNP